MKKIVVKLGRSIATSKRNKIDSFRFEQLAKQIVLLQKQHIAVVLVVSAAVCCGEKELNLKEQDVVTKSLAAGVGQAVVMATLYNIFRKHSLKIGQLLVTKADIEDAVKRKNIETVLHQAAEQRITLIVNENDIVELHSFGGNDYLAVEIAKLAHADSLLLLTDVQGVLNKHMHVIPTLVQEEHIAHIKSTAHKGQVGGMTGKLDAARNAVRSGISTWIAYGKTQNLLTRMVLQHEHIGTKIMSS